MKTRIFQNIIKNDKKKIAEGIYITYPIAQERTKLLADAVEKVIDDFFKNADWDYKTTTELKQELKTKLSELKI